MINEKLKFIRELMKMEHPEESTQYIRDHMSWPMDELKEYRNKLQASCS